MTTDTLPILRRTRVRLLDSPSLILLAALMLLSRPGSAQTSGSVHPTTPPVAHAARRIGEIVLDGRLDESAWQAAGLIDQFTETQPTEGIPATQRAEVRILYDDAAIYIGARLYDSLGGRGVHTRLARRDELLNLDNGMSSQVTSDKLILTFDTYHDHLGRAVFEINPSGVRGDALGEGGSNLDPSWDPIWEAKTLIDSLGWTAEIRIPLSQLRFSQDSTQIWGLQVERVVDRIHELDDWAYWRKNESGGPSRYGHLVGLAVQARPRQLELFPYTVARGSILPSAPGDPFNSGHETSARVGGDLRYHLTSNLTLDATVNPDFGQVEVDPAVVNLSAFETFFPEKRPFFVAGSNAFDFGGFNCFFCSNTSSLSPFYTRRIGRRPQLDDFVSGNSQFSDLPQNSTIFGAAKVTGRTSGGYTIGILDALTREEQASMVSSLGGPVSMQAVEPLTNYFVARVRKDLAQGTTQVGGILTSTLRRLDDTLFQNQLRSRAEVAGVDFFHTWHARNYSLMGSFALSNVEGSPAAIALTQRSSAHYFQRPDRGNTSDGLFSTGYDTTATSLRGYGGYLRLAKDNGDWLGEIATNVRSPGFEMNDLAFLSRADYIWMSSNLAHQWTVPKKHYRNIFALIGTQRQYTFEGDRNDFQIHSNFSIDFPNYWSFQVFGIHRPTTLDDRLTRGGPVVKRNGINDLFVSVSTDSRKFAVLSAQAEYTLREDDPAHELFLSATLLMKPAANVSFSLGPSLDRPRGFLQYVTAVADPTATSFSGTRYVFSSINQTTFSMDTRLNYTFTPKLTVELFAQPFIASGKYFNFEEFNQPRSLQKSVYGRDIGSITPVTDPSGQTTQYTIDPDGGGPAAPFAIDNPNFNVLSLRGNLVLRWEYRPGSALFVVWTHEQNGDGTTGDFVFHRDFSSLVRAPSTDIFLVKLSYRFGR